MTLGVGGGASFFFLSANAEPGASSVRPSIRHITTRALRLRLRIKLALTSDIFILLNTYYRFVRSLCQATQKARLLAWSFTSRSGCAEACGCWQDMQLILA